MSLVGLLAGLPSTARGQISPTDWIPQTGDFMVEGNWTDGVPGTSGLKTGFFFIDNGGTAELGEHIEVFGGFIGWGAGQSGTLSIQAGGNLELIRRSGEFGDFGVLRVGDNGTGMLTVATGGQVTGVNLFAGNAAGGVGTVTIQGGILTMSGVVQAGVVEGSSGAIDVQSGTLNVEDTITVGNQGAGTLTVGGSVNSVTAVVGASETGVGEVSLTGGTWTNTGDFYLGMSGQGTLHVEGGGILQVDGTVYVSYNEGAQGAVTIDEGQWTVGTWLVLGENSGGSITVNEGGLLQAPIITVSNDSTVGESTLDINGGTVEAGQIAGLSNGSVTIANGTIRVTQDNAGYFAGFDSGDVTLSEGDVTFDTQEYHIATSTVLDGGARLIKAGVGRLGLSAANTYSGGTYLQAGEILINNSESIGTGALEMDTAELRSTADATLSLPEITINAGQHGTFSTATGTTLTLESSTFEIGRAHV